MGELAQLITALAALVTAFGGAFAAIILAIRASGRQRVAAAEEATRLSRPPAGRHRRDHQRGSDAVARGAVDMARDNVELAREAGREVRFHDLEHADVDHPLPPDLGPDPLPGGGVDV